MLRLCDLVEVSSAGMIDISYRELLSVEGDYCFRLMRFSCHFENGDSIPTGLWRSHVKRIQYLNSTAIVSVEGVEYNGRFYETEFDASIAMINDKYE